MSRLFTGVLFLGAASILLPATECADCHAAIARRQRASHHANTLSRYEESRLAGVLGAVELDGFRYQYDPSGVKVSRNTERAGGTLEWAFGAGAQGFTPVGRYEGLYFEHRLSYYASPGISALTPGHLAAIPKTGAEALGVLKLPPDIYKCFDCHSTGLSPDPEGGPDLSKMTPGITCERCHGPGQAHITAARSGRPSAEITKSIFDAGRLPAKAVVEICGGCHRLPERPSDTPEIDNPVSVRFQPVGLMASRCFRESGKLSCVTCHDPHEDVRRDSELYTAKCMSCHAFTSAPIRACKRAEGQDCVTCHMRKASPLPYLTFTDHRIRVYR